MAPNDEKKDSNYIDTLFFTVTVLDFIFVSISFTHRGQFSRHDMFDRVSCVGETAHVQTIWLSKLLQVSDEVFTNQI